MSNIFSLFGAAIFIFIFIFNIMKLIKLNIENTKLKVQMINLVQENQVFKTLLDQKDSAHVEKTEGFLNFVTQSRDWAFEYIEDVQKVVNKVIDDTSSTVDYHNKFGSMEIEPYATQISTLVTAIEELKFLLPNEEFFK